MKLDFKDMWERQSYSSDKFSYKDQYTDSPLIRDVLSQLSGKEKEDAIQFYGMLFEKPDITIEPNPFNL